MTTRLAPAITTPSCSGPLSTPTTPLVGSRARFQHGGRGVGLGQPLHHAMRGAGPGRDHHRVPAGRDMGAQHRKDARRCRADDHGPTARPGCPARSPIRRLSWLNVHHGWPRPGRRGPHVVQLGESRPAQLLDVDRARHCPCAATDQDASRNSRPVLIRSAARVRTFSGSHSNTGVPSASCSTSRPRARRAAAPAAAPPSRRRVCPRPAWPASR